MGNNPCNCEIKSMFKISVLVNKYTMSKFRLINILDIIFITIASFLLVFAWVQFFLRNLIFSLLISAIITSSMLITIKLIKSKHLSRLQNKTRLEADILKFKLTIQTLPSTKFAQLIKKIIPKDLDPHIQKGDIIFTNNNFPTTCTYASDLNINTLLKIIKEKPTNSLIIFCPDYSQDVKHISTSFQNKSIKLVKLDELYPIFNQHNIQIDTSNINLHKCKLTLKEIALNAISRDKSKGYFISGIILLFTSIIIPFKIYYVIFSTILMSLSIICRFRTKPKTSKNFFD